MIIRSLLTQENPFNSTVQIKDWIRQRNKEVVVDVKKIPFAVKKPHSENYIFSPIYGYTEILLEEGTHVNEGEVGEIVVTGFNHYVMPFNRYKTGDLAEYGGDTSEWFCCSKYIIGTFN